MDDVMPIAIRKNPSATMSPPVGHSPVTIRKMHQNVNKEKQGSEHLPNPAGACRTPGKPQSGGEEKRCGLACEDHRLEQIKPKAGARQPEIRRGPDGQEQPAEKEIESLSLSRSHRGRASLQGVALDAPVVGCVPQDWRDQNPGLPP